MARSLSTDPYKTFRFKVYFDSSTSPVAGISSVGGLSWSVAVDSLDEGGNYQSESKLPGQITYEPVTLSRGITAEQSFKEWAQKVWNYNQENSLKGLYRTVKIELCDDNGNPAIVYTLINCWVSGYEALPKLDADDNALAIESLTLEHEGWTHEVKNEGARKAGYGSPLDLS